MFDSKAIQEIRQTVQNRLLDLRGLKRLVDSQQFEDAYALASAEQREALRVVLKSESPVNLKLWIRGVVANSPRELGELTMKELRTLATQKGVSNYSRLSKGELLSELARLDERGTADGD